MVFIQIEDKGGREGAVRMEHYTAVAVKNTNRRGSACSCPFETAASLKKVTFFVGGLSEAEAPPSDATAADEARSEARGIEKIDVGT